MADEHDFLGTGWSFPLEINGRGGIGLAHGHRDIEQAIGIILSTPIGERRMRPQFGCGVHDLVFAGNDPSTHGLVRYHVQRALELWEPRVEVQGVQVGVDPDHPERILVNVLYNVRATNERRNLVYPFYLIPDEG